ncbi:TetR/AcrR family transcriptional regulator [Roseomonas sp. GC11]|uniref:TetR/AcrR family transcriptional regulator n=1 Tax=Roseomonas sp. GC11 TaxID=2950546 RepID=UPI0021086447|nr:TetR/AcrR family transcriptional regulator [Roseomonas sp. GC11]MCQ4158330.1 TetR/AcrR family transcriptional regulator [Roseomonas sp. GC11]
MARIPGSDGRRTAALIRAAGLALIHRHGYEAMSLRQLAAEVGLQPASLYNHFPTKQALLHGLIHDHMEALLSSTAAALSAAAPDPLSRLRAFIAHHLLYHLEKKPEVFIANFELRALEGENLRAILALRRRYEMLLTDILEAGMAAGVLRPGDAQIAAYAILAMLTGACTWYRPEGRLTRGEIVRIHTDLILHGHAA